MLLKLAILDFKDDSEYGHVKVTPLHNSGTLRT